MDFLIKKIKKELINNNFMNSVDKNPNYKKMYLIAKELFKKKKNHFASGPFDETFFTLRVFESAKKIIKLLKKPVKEQEILSATIFHDIGKIKLKIKKLMGKQGFAETFREEWHRHPKLSAKMAKPILKKLGHSDEFIENVCYLIQNHDNRKIDIKDKSIELQIVQDADYLGDTGYAGFIRPFTWSGKFKRGIIGSIEYMKNNKNTRLNDDKINLNISKKLIKETSKIEDELKQKMIELIDSELL